MDQQQENYKALLGGLAHILSDKAKIDTIRPSQQKVLKEFIYSSEQFKTGIFDLATAFGKTRIMALLAEAYHSRADRQIIVVEPTKELVRQIAGEFSDYFGKSLKVGQFYSDQKDTTQPILVTTYNSLDKLAQTIDPKSTGILLLDEGHHAVSDKRMEIVRRFSNACQYGMTATPDYSEDRTLKNLLTNTIAHVDICQGIRDGILSPFSNIVLFSKFQMDLSQVKRTGTGDYDIAEYRQAFSKALSPVHMPNTDDSDWQSAHRKVAHEVALFYQSMSTHKKHCLINCHTQEEAQIQAEEINKVCGAPVAGVWTTNTQQTSALSDFESGKLGALCQVGMLQEGYDFPALDLCINYPTASSVRATQRGGRTLRLDPDNPQKQATIVDIVFSFPGSHNPYTSARKNGQVLYSDVVKAIYVAPKSTTHKNRRASLSLPKLPTLNLSHFKVLSDIQSLLSLKRKDQQKQAAEYVPLKQEGMLSVNDITDILGGTPSKYVELFQEIYANADLNSQIDDEGNPFQLIHRVKSGNCETLCLSNNPAAMEIFTKICDEKYQRRNANKIQLEEYAQGHYLPKEDLYKICLDLHAFKFKIPDENGTERTLIAKHQQNPNSLLLLDTPEARQDLNALISLADYLKRVPPMPQDMCDYEAFKDKLMLANEMLDPFIRRAILDEITYTDKNGQKKPLAQFYSVKSEYSNDMFYHICVPNDAQGQLALLHFCGFKIFHEKASHIFNHTHSWYDDDEIPEAWHIYKRNCVEGKSFRDIARELNVTPTRVWQIIHRVHSELKYTMDTIGAIPDKHLKFCKIRREQTPKDILCVSDSEGEVLFSQNRLRREHFDSGFYSYYTRNKISRARIIRFDHLQRFKEREPEY